MPGTSPTLQEWIKRSEGRLRDLLKRARRTNLLSEGVNQFRDVYGMCNADRPSGNTITGLANLISYWVTVTASASTGYLALGLAYPGHGTDNVLVI